MNTNFRNPIADTVSIFCPICNSKVRTSGKRRVNGTWFGFCDTCKFTAMINLDNKRNHYICAMQKRFKHNKIVYHMTYSIDLGTTTFVKVQKKIKGISQAEHYYNRWHQDFDGFMTPERFATLVSFL